MKYYLIDTNVFLHTINSNITVVAQKCKDIENDMTVTPTILKELEPGFYMESENPESKEIYTCVCNLSGGYCEIIKLVELSHVEGAEAEFNKIRDRHYGWITNAEYLKQLIEDGTLSQEDRKKLKNKDKGECELLAIAKASKGEYRLVTNDKGRVYIHPHDNIFEKYANDEHVTILIGEDWLKELELVNAIN